MATIAIHYLEYNNTNSVVIPYFVGVVFRIILGIITNSILNLINLSEPSQLPRIIFHYTVYYIPDPERPLQKPGTHHTNTFELYVTHGYYYNSALCVAAIWISTKIFMFLLRFMYKRS